jgi:CpeT protein
MRIAFPIFALWLGLIAAVGCIGTRSQSGEDSDLNQLMELITGTFISKAQTNQDSSYSPMVLHVCPIWPDRGAWLYVEQALVSQPDQPYRQQVYHLEQLAAGRLRSVVYTLPHPSQWVGAWQSPERFAKLSPLKLEVRSGCDLYFNKTGRRTFSGATDGRSCRSDLRGASYATAEITVTKNKLICWGRGFDAKGQQVWGAAEGGYLFKQK